MNNIIKKIWNEKYHPSEKHVACNDEIVKMELEIEEKEKELLSGLSEDKILLFEKISYCHIELLDLKELDAFTKGIRFATKFVLDATKDD